MKDEMFEFRKNALQGALTSPLCKEYNVEWFANSNNKEKLVALALRQQSCPYFAHHCYMGKGLSMEYLKSEFSKYINGYTIKDADGVQGYTYGLYVDYDFANGITMDKDVAHVMWTRNEIIIPVSKCPTVYVSNKSNVSVVCEGCNYVRIYIFDESSVTLDDIDNDSNVAIYKYSDKCVVKKERYCLGVVKEFRKELRL